MSHRGCALALVLAAFGCGGKSANQVTAPADDCEPGRCLGDISERMEVQRPAARACYETGHAKFPSLEGRVTINLEIDPSGAVVDASQSAQDGQITDEEVVNCIVGVVRQITFAPSKLGKTTKAFHRYEFSKP